MNDNWYNFTIKKSTNIETIISCLNELSMDYVLLTDICYPNPLLQKLLYKNLNYVFVRADINKYGWLIDNIDKKPTKYLDAEVSKIIDFFTNYNGELRIEHIIPLKVKVCTITYLNMKHIQGLCMPIKDKNILKFYMTLLDDMIISISVPSKYIFV